jgi:CysZ protein
MKQETPRAIIPLFLSTTLIVLGWLLPFGPIWVLFSSIFSCAFMAWDYTDLVPARRMMSFKERSRMFKKTFFTHVAFGLPLIIPILNVILFSIGPISGTILFLKMTKEI